MARNEYLQDHRTKKTVLKVFLTGGTMLVGKINDFDDLSIVLDKCLIDRDKIISMVPQL
jgi:sRNA-binding regulator protein Hfq